MRALVSPQDGQSPSEAARDLHDWLERERIDGLAISVRPNGESPPGSMGMPPEILELAAPGGAIGMIAASIAAWMKVRRPDITVKFDAKGNVTELSGKGLKDAEVRDLIRHLLSEGGDDSAE